MLREETLEYHSRGRPGKIAIAITKPSQTQHDLALAYTPGVAEAVREIARDPAMADLYTARANLVGVVTNGTAVLGLGNVGPLAGKPVMEGKALLFKRFADIDVFDIELNASDPDDVVRVVQALEPTFGGINLEDIKAPECFEIEQRLQSLSIPVFHDDQHGTAIIIAAGLTNALDVAGKRIDEVRLVVSGAGASALATVQLLVLMGLPREHIVLVDRHGVIHRGREEGMDPYKRRFATDLEARTLAEAMRGADVFLGLSAGGLVSGDMVRSMALRPIVFSLANPDPEISYAAARSARPDAIVATGRSDDPNQVNNVLAFPFVFRGALDVHATAINEEMQLAAALTIAALAREPIFPRVLRMYGLTELHYGPDYLLPKALDPRVALWVAPAVARAAMETGVARRPLDLDGYPEALAARLALNDLVSSAEIAVVDTEEEKEAIP